MSTYFGWVLAAYFVNINVAFVDAGAGTAVQVGIALPSLVLLAVISAIFAWPRRDPIVGGVAAWVLIAIGIELMTKQTEGIYMWSSRRALLTN